MNIRPCKGGINLGGRPKGLRYGQWDGTWQA
jgi:hypothetical protein